ncbi:hypothetical protein ACO0LD_16910 [Undibacterium sp. Ji83W]|uniref:hypothetical protein n=1 Tax=Undibacterium sp. Ji83W TaxID=3413043 RepID=UPI003BF2F951
MGNGNFFDVLIEIKGEQADLNTFAQQHFVHRIFSLNSIIKMPESLDFEMNNFVEDGYDALFGNWRKLTGRWMFKEAAKELGYPFPLVSQEQVIKCIKTLGDEGDKRIFYGELFKSNIDQFGYGHAFEWRKKNWGIECDASDVVIDSSSSIINLIFSLCGPPPKKILTLISKSHSSLNFTISYVDETGRRCKKMFIKNGKNTEDEVSSVDELKHLIWNTRKVLVLNWLNKVLGKKTTEENIELSESGRVFINGTKISVDFLIRRVALGDSIESLLLRFSELTPLHMSVLNTLVEESYNA